MKVIKENGTEKANFDFVIEKYENYNIIIISFQ